MDGSLLPFARDRKYSTAIEYGLIAALIAAITVAGLTYLGTRLNSEYNHIAAAVARVA